MEKGKSATKRKFRFNNNLVIFTAFAVIGFAVYSNTINSPFLFDDQAHIKDNTHIRLTELKLQNIADAAFKSPLPERPVANISFALNYFFFHYNVISYHLINIFIHIISATFLFLLLKNTFTLPLFQNRYRHSQLLAFAAATVWLLHPVQTQAVTYIVQRMTSLAAMFYIMSIFFYAKGRLSQQIKKRSWPWFCSCAISAILSFGCKEISATLPVFILLYEWFFLQNLDTNWLKRNFSLVIAASFLILVLSYFYLSSEIVRIMAAEHQRWGFTITERFLTEFRVIVFYISLLLYPNPARLNLDHDFSISTSLFNPPQTLICIIIVFALLISSILLAKRSRLISFCILWFFGNLLIESSFLGIELIYEHRLYLPSMFAVCAITCLLWKLLRPLPVKIAAFSVLSCLLFIATYHRNQVWADELTLWQDCVAKSPNRSRSNYNLATVLYERKDYPQAIKFYNKSLQLDARRFDAYEGLALSYLSEEKIQQALEYADKAIALNSKSARGYYAKGLALCRQNCFDQAIPNFLRAIEIEPTYDKFYTKLGVIYNQNNQFDKASFYWNKAIQLNPDSPEPLNNLAWLMATSPDIKYRNPAESLRLAIKANKITGYKQPDLLDTLAAAYSNAGQFDKAVSFAEKAVELATAQGNNILSETIKSRLHLYKMRQPFRETPGQSNAEENRKTQENK
jgi:tetratricopeptide (TPR) repeat protein